MHEKANLALQTLAGCDYPVSASGIEEDGRIRGYVERDLVPLSDQLYARLVHRVSEAEFVEDIRIMAAQVGHDNRSLREMSLDASVAARASLHRSARAALQCDGARSMRPRLTTRIARWRSRGG
jgi:hypothetical protein